MQYNKKRLKQKNLEIQHLKTGIRILNRAIERILDNQIKELKSTYNGYNNLELISNILLIFDRIFLFSLPRSGN
jgi:hypothetical protein